MRVLGVIALALAVSAGAASARPSADPGLSSGEIVIGGTVPLSGIAASYASVGRGAEAYFKYVNARGGVNKRKITYKYVDDQYNPAQTVQATRQLVQQDRVFAIFNSLGTEHNLSVRSFLNATKVPQLFAGSGATTFGRDYKRYPYTIGFLPSYVGEGKVYARHITKTKPNAKIAVLFQNDDYGKDLLGGFKAGLGAKRKNLVAEQSYDPLSTDVSSQVYVNQVGSATNIMRIVSATANPRTIEGAITLISIKDPLMPRFKNDAGMKLYKSIMRQYLPRGDVNDGFHVYSMAVAYTFVEALKKAGRNPTRASLVRAVANLNLRNNPFLIPGVAVRTSPTDHFPLDQGQLQRWSKNQWNPLGKVISAK